MATIKSTIQLYDAFSSPLMNIANAVDSTMPMMEQMQSAMNRPIDTTPIQGFEDQILATANAAQDLDDTMRGMDLTPEIEAANSAYEDLEDSVERTTPHIRENTREQDRFNEKIREGANSADDLFGTISKAVGAFAGMATVRKAFGFIQNATDAFDSHMNAQVQLMTVLANMMDSDYVSQFEVETYADTSGAIEDINSIQNSVDAVTVPVSAETRALTAAYDKIASKAAEIQSNGIYDDDAMLAAGAEFATYFTDTDAISMMMDTLSNYAMGMSGGGALDNTAMVDYATNLGKIMSGSYDAMTKKGFEFTEAQKAIIEGEATREQIVSALGEEYLDMSSDMQAAAAISQVIDEAWAGLYQSMSNTPQGKIIQLTNAWGDMLEVIGGQLYPYVILFVDTINENWPTIETVIEGIVTGLEVMMGILDWILQGAINVAQGIIDNWSLIAPVLSVVTAALAGYVAVLVVYNTVQAISNGIKAAAAFMEKVHAAALMMEQGATFAATAAQHGFNAALMACPLTWIVIIIIAVIALIYLVVAAINKLTGSSISATGIICGALAVAAAFIGNLFIALINFLIDIFVVFWNFIAAFANFFANVFNDPVGAVARLFFDLVDTVLSLLQSLASAIDTIFGSNLAGAVQGWRDSLSGWVDETFGQGTEIMAQLSAEDMHLGRFEYGSAWDAGYKFGEGIDQSIAEFDPSSLFGTTDIPTPEDYAQTMTYNMDDSNIGSDLGDIAGNTGSMANELSDSAEDLKYLRDIAEQEAINRFTTAEITIEQTNNNNISSDMDLDGVVDYLTDAVGEAVEEIAEGVRV